MRDTVLVIVHTLKPSSLAHSLQNSLYRTPWSTDPCILGLAWKMCPYNYHIFGFFFLQLPWMLFINFVSSTTMHVSCALNVWDISLVDMWAPRLEHLKISQWSHIYFNWTNYQPISTIYINHILNYDLTNLISKGKHITKVITLSTWSSFSNTKLK